MFTLLAAMYIHPTLTVLIVKLVYHTNVLGRLAEATIIPLATWLVLASMFLLAAGHSAQVDSQSYKQKSGASAEV
jgi:hypothetical protein